MPWKNLFHSCYFKGLLKVASSPPKKRERDKKKNTYFCTTGTAVSHMKVEQKIRHEMSPHKKLNVTTISSNSDVF